LILGFALAGRIFGEKMNILLLGSGGREHAFAWKIVQSALCNRLFVAPGNPGIAAHGVPVAIDPNDFAAIADFVLKESISMVIVGPEEPLVRGIFDYFQQRPDLAQVQVVGPSRDAARLEGSKAYAKVFMQEMGIPTAAYREFSAETLEEGLAWVAAHPLPVVLKADGLAAGKGVLICHSHEEALTEFKAMLGGKFGSAGNKVVVEAFLQGREFSVFVLTNGAQYKILPIAKDYKRVGEGDTGLNTGGMGAVSPVSFVDEALMAKVRERIVVPTIAGIQRRGLIYQGFVFLGLIEVAGDPYVIEYNCRMGDPETEVVLPRLKSDLLVLLRAMGEGHLDAFEVEEDPLAAATVMLVSGGYPGDYVKGKAISGLDEVAGSLVFHAGTQEPAPGQLVTNGGRVMAITSFGRDFRDALEVSYANADKIHFERKYFRRDIGFDL
jgi:phosphoribosylamine--glycine ligase